MYFHYFVIISPWIRAVPFIWTNLNLLHPRMLCAKFGWNWPSGSGEEDENVKSLQTDGRTDRQTDAGRQVIRKAHLSFQLRWAKMSEPISSGTIRENTNRWYLLKYPIFHVEIICEYTLRNAKSCVWISVKMNLYFWCYIKNTGIQYRNSRPGSWFNTHFTNTHVNTNRGLKKRIRVYFHLKYYQTLNPVCTFNQYHKKIFNFT